MLDIKYIRDNIDDVKDALAKKGFSFNDVEFGRLDDARKKALTEAQSLQAEKKKASKQIGQLIGQGMSPEEAKAQVMSGLDADITRAEQAAKQVESDLREMLMAIPNVPLAEVPAGNDEDDNVEVLKWGEPREFSFEPKDHVDVGEPHGLNFDAGAVVAGSRFAVMSGPIARMHRALTQFMLDMHTLEHGYEETYVPYLVNRQALEGTGQLPKFEEDLFKIPQAQGDKDLYMIPTAEVPVTNLLRDTVNDVELPVKKVAHTPCFRSEAGSYGRDTRGMIRQHQFDKVELVQFVKAEDSEKTLEELTGHAEAILQKLNLPYRKVILCGGDLGFSAAKTYDLEVWLPGQQKYREISSCSTFGDYQARRMQARWRNPQTGKPELLHTLNGSGLAVGRTLVAILENYQEEDGSVSVPVALRPYMGGTERISTAKVGTERKGV
ncbi:seryl-tRNA synthetase [Thalassolituus maritimus]|uniref:Serine--tRNA ligase n=1 Tax=Thalassolituus maritimus TaxID=484498 RepID=A0A1N7PYW4_9GAMM|nr:serine--tRNA ligase [Thalassolituus maritimus]SIT15629.1 seryl-tRNA synthetase [Thalassolituus maritimus]